MFGSSQQAAVIINTSETDFTIKWRGKNQETEISLTANKPKMKKNVKLVL
jgi:hypothetical protein